MLVKYLYHDILPSPKRLYNPLGFLHNYALGEVIVVISPFFDRLPSQFLNHIPISQYSLIMTPFPPMTMEDTMPIVTASMLEDVQDILAIMRRQEMSHYRRSDYLAEIRPEVDRVVDGSWRQRIIEWMYGVVDHCSLRRDSVAVAAYYVDLCVIKGVINSREEFQLAAMTALQLAIKLYDSTMVTLKSMVKLGRGLFSEEDVIEMEAKMLKALNWQVHPPTPACFLRQFLRLLPPTVSPLTRYMIAEVTRFISEISVCLYRFVKYSPSAVAYAGMLIAMERVDEVSLPIWQRQQIFSAMSNAVKLEHTSPEVVAAVKDLHHSLQKNITLKELMDTIDAQCHDGYNNFRSVEYICHGGMNSPRDVTGRH
jgi:hypothetical protein